MKTAERIVMMSIFLCLIGGGVWIYVSVKQEQQSVRDAVARGEFETPTGDVASEVTPDDWQVIYPNTIPLIIGSTTVRASVADTLPKRIKGLSGTPFLPDRVVKLFVFGAPGPHSIWMKDMQYPIDIMWLTKEGEIVHIEERVQPDTYSPEDPRASESYESPVPAWYVIEANAGFVASNTIAIGDKVLLP